MSNKKKAIHLPSLLVQKLNNKMETLISGNHINGFLIYLNKNIEILKEEGIIFEDVPKIEDIKDGEIEYGNFTSDIIKRAIERSPFEGRPKVIKALIIAAFGEDWKLVFEQFYLEHEGILRLKEIEEKQKYSVESITFPSTIQARNLDRHSDFTNHSFIQWENYVLVPFQDFLKKLKCQVKLNSFYYKFGFVLYSKSQDAINRLSITISNEEYWPEITISKALTIIERKPISFIDSDTKNPIILLEIIINKDNLLCLSVNEKILFETLIDKELREGAYIKTWNGEFNKFHLEFLNIEVVSGCEQY